MANDSTIENAIKGLMDFTDENLDTYLAAIKLKKGDELSTPSIREHARDDGDPYLRKIFPSIQYYQSNIVDKYLTTGKNEVIITANMLITIKEGTEIVKKMDRYVEAVRQMINDDESIGGSIDKLGPEISINIFPSIDGKKAALVTMEIIKVVNHLQS